MKIRDGFVSNSSSSSFVINKNDITALQKDLIINHMDEAEKYGIDSYNWPWHITDTGQMLEGYTDMDNFDMQEFMRRIGVDLSKVSFDGHISGDWNL